MTTDSHSATSFGFSSDEVLKSHLLLDAQSLRARGETDEAANRFAQAAEIEERLGQACLVHNDTLSSWIHLFSAMSCWAQAGNFHVAIMLGDQLLARPDLPTQLRQSIDEYSRQLRKRRSEWSADLALAESVAG